MFQTKKDLEKSEKELRQKKLKKLRKFYDDNFNLYFACLTRFDSQYESRKERGTIYTFKPIKKSHCLG